MADGSSTIVTIVLVLLRLSVSRAGTVSVRQELVFVGGGEPWPAKERRSWSTQAKLLCRENESAPQPKG